MESAIKPISIDFTIVNKIEEEYNLSIPNLGESFPHNGTVGYSTDKYGRITSLKINQKFLTKFPEQILELTELENLELTSNQINHLPDNITKLEKLKRLHLKGNLINELPNNISKLTGLISLRLKGNPITYPPPEIIKQGFASIINYLSSINYKSLNEVKVILVGDGSSGKTSLLKRITNGEFNINEEKTHGIIIEKSNFHISNEEHYKINFWDFGGQEIMHSTHQFFLSKRSLYILLLDGRKEEEPEYWLKHIQTFGGNSPVIIVLNKYDDNPSFDINRKFLSEKYKNIRGFIKTSCKTKYNIDKFVDMLQKEITEIEHISTLWPAEWFDIKRELEEIKSNYISYEKYQEICNINSLDDRNKQNSLIEFLNDLGTILHFDDLYLSETNVINPRWITSAVYSIINSEIVFRRRGILNLNNLRQILNEEDYPHVKYGYIVGLMKKFELCYSIDDNQILIPDLLDVQEPDFNFDYRKSLQFLYKYDFLPRSIIPRFIVKSNLEIYKNLKWRTGVILQDKDYDSFAVIKCDYENSTIEIFVNGENKIEYLSIIRKRLNDLNDSFSLVNLTEKIPCNCRVCKNSKNPFFFNYKTLLKAKSKKRAFLPCEKDMEDINIVELLKGVDMQVSETNWNTFISYSTLDSAAVNSLTELFRSRKITYWLDKEQIKPGDSISSRIENGLDNSDFILLCISRNQIRSGWSRAEYTSLLHDILSNRTDKKILPILIDDITSNEIPRLLRDYKYIKYDKEGIDELLDFLK